jgi:hypothetical protein
MGRKWKQEVGRIRIRHPKTGEERELIEMATFEEQRDMHGSAIVQHRLKDVASPDGRRVSVMTGGRTVWFADDPHTQWDIVQD